MLVQPVLIPASGMLSWTVLGDDNVPVVPVDRFLADDPDFSVSRPTVYRALQRALALAAVSVRLTGYVVNGI